ncbi:MAG TPA: ROK family protein, partial [Clostridia bacterium]|nr:ROK family protein [Clostridia bacterium]
MKYSLGLDIGGTKCAVVLGQSVLPQESLEGFIVDKLDFPTQQKRGWRAVIDEFFSVCDSILLRNALKASDITAIGISCGGPLSSAQGVIYSPPNLPDWDGVPIVALFNERYGVPVYLQNDANACALAEWRFGAGKGYSNLIFLTFGTGMGAGLILDGKLYSGTNDMAGEVGHIRLAETGPTGYGKVGSFEGYCSGAGIAKLAKSIIAEKLKKNEPQELCKTEDDLCHITAKSLAQAAKGGDELAIEIYRICGEHLGKGLAVLIDILNPQAIVIGSIFERSSELLIPAMEKSLQTEALGISLDCCEIL